MSARKWFSVLAAVAFAVLLGPVGAEEKLKGTVDLRADDGSAWISADDIVSYTWETHTLSLKPGIRAELTKRLLASRRLVDGVPFAFALNGQTVYKGRFTSILSSLSQDAVVIVIDHDHVDRVLTKDQFRIALGYPGPEFYTSTDPRTDPRVHKALVDHGKLQHELSHGEWVAATLKDIETLKPGMTRAQVLKLFEADGGLATRRQQRYIHRQCPYIKVDATFEPVGNPDDKLSDNSQDKLVSLSKPFLEWPILD